MSCIRVKYEAGESTDRFLPKLINSIKEERMNSNDDFTIFVCGPRGSGKSMLGLYMSEMYMGDKASVEYIGLNPIDFAKALKKASDSPKPRMCNNDEANLSKRDSGRTYNKDILDMYYSIRGKNIFHIWNNPSLDIIDKKFIEDIVNGIIFIFTKDKKRPRLYYYFTKQAILNIMSNEESLSLRMLKQNAESKAMFRGWFKDYFGVLREPYMQKKESRMEEKIDTFYNKYVKEEEYLKIGQLKKFVGVSESCVLNHVEKIKNNELYKEEYIIRTPSGIKKYNPNIVPLIIESLKLSRKKVYENGLKNIRDAKNENEEMA
jgi:hypothetical protein